jgi:hypothetical protein
MINKYLLLFGLTILFFLSGNLSAQTLKLPFKDVGACPFECCTYREWTANKDTILYQQMKDGSPLAFKVRKKETVTGITGVVITTKPGIGKALKDVTVEIYEDNSQRQKKIKFRKGELLKLLTYQGEGFYSVWHQGKTYSVNLDDGNIKQLSRPISIWWVKIKNKKGQTGWTKLPENFDNMDSCG